MKSVGLLSGKGGVGKTSAAAALAWALSDAGRRVVAVDADFALGNLDLALGVEPGPSLAARILTGSSLAGLARPITERLSVVSAGHGDPRLARLGERDLSLGLGAIIVESGGADLVIVDGPTGVGPGARAVAGAVGEVVVVFEPEGSSVADALGCLAAVRDVLRRPEVWGLVNRTAGPGQARAAMEALVRSAGDLLGLRVEPVGLWPQSDSFARALRRRSVRSWVGGRSLAAGAVRRAALSVAGALPQLVGRPLLDGMRPSLASETSERKAA